MELGPRAAARLVEVAAATARTRARGVRERRRDRTYSFAGRAVLLATGGGSLGAALARRFAHAGARVALVGTAAERLGAIENELYRTGADVVRLVLDAAEESGARAAVSETVARFGSLDVLVNASARVDSGSIDHTTSSTFEHAMAAQFFAPLHLVQAALPALRQRRSGRIVNVGSLAAFTSLPQLLPYAATQGALAGLSRGLGAELAAEGIHVTTVFPGLIRSEAARRLWRSRRVGRLWRSVADALPLLAVDPDRAAAEIVEACRAGKAQLVISWPAKLATVASAAAPGLVSSVLASLYRRAREPERRDDRPS